MKRTRAPLFALLGGLGVFLLGWSLARTHLPEWQLGPWLDRAGFEARYQQLARVIGVEPTGPAPTFRLRPGLGAGNNPYQVFGPAGAQWLASRQRPLLVAAEAPGKHAGAGDVKLGMEFGLDGRPWQVSFTRAGFWSFFTPLSAREFPQPRMTLLDSGESVGQSIPATFAGSVTQAASIVGAPFEEQLRWLDSAKGPQWFVSRAPGPAVAFDTSSILKPKLVSVAIILLVFLAVLVLAIGLAIQRRIDLVNGAIVSALATLVSFVSALAAGGDTLSWFGYAVATGFSSLFLFLLWAAAESWLRGTGHEVTSALDALRRGRVGRKVGQAVLWGLGAGAAAAGVRLAVFTLPTMFPWAVAEELSIRVPFFTPGATPLDWGLEIAGLTLLGLASARQVFKDRRALWLATLLGAALCLPLLSDFRPLPLTLAATLATVALFVCAFARAGSLALAVAGVVMFLLPTVAFSVQNLGWMGGSFAGSAGLLGGLGLLGLVGWWRPDVVEERVQAPGFVRRLEKEQRLQYEMDLLARMQEGLLPAELPRVEGWELAARSVMANEVGGDFYDFFREADGSLWIAAGDVAGHGLSCSITHAMTKAALASLIGPGRTPAEVLGEVDRVLRTLKASRVFTSLALARLEPESGKLLLANAGFPYPLTRHGTEIAELVLPGLPLGDGPPRRYRDLELTVFPGGAMVFGSDGLFEALGADGEPYGFDRPREVLAATAAQTADQLLAALTEDWHRAVGPRAEDDTTLVVIRRVA